MQAAAARGFSSVDTIRGLPPWHITLKTGLARKPDLRGDWLVSNFEREPCPWLPIVSERLGPAATRVHAAEKGAAFYLAALSYAQSLWLEGKPAQAILQLNKSLMADLKGDEPILAEFPPPYRALRWIIRQAKTGEMGFMGNPVRHFQHLASRMSGPRAELRSWRAWACFYLASAELAGVGFFQDGEQLAREGLWVPGWSRVWDEVAKWGWQGEVAELTFASVP